MRFWVVIRMIVLVAICFQNLKVNGTETPSGNQNRLSSSSGGGTGGGKKLVPPAWLPRYDVAMNLHISGHFVRVVENVTWTNPCDRPTNRLVFNIHSHYQPPSNPIEILKLAKMLEIMRIAGKEGIYSQPAFNLKQTTLLKIADKELEKTAISSYFDPAMPTTLIIDLPQSIKQGESVSVQIEFDFVLPQKQGRWGQWRGVTYLSNWLPVCSYYDQRGWRPTPFVPWHQPFYNEAGVYRVSARLPADQVIACTGTVESKMIDHNQQEVQIGPIVSRDFAFLCSKDYKNFSGQAENIKVNVMAFQEHEFYAKKIVDVIVSALNEYQKWFGPFPYPEFTIAESYFGWNGNECSDLVMIDQRVFMMPELMSGYVEYLVSHETCHQWFYNTIGTDGYRETFMDEAFATYFAHRHLNRTKGKNNELLHFPKLVKWLPNINRENYRMSQFYSTLNRGELQPPLQEMEKYEHVGNLFSSVYDRGSMILGMIEERLGETAFLDFMRYLFRKYYFRVIHIEDFQRELEQYTGQDWQPFFKDWLHGKGMSDWSLKSAKLKPLSELDPELSKNLNNSSKTNDLSAGGSSGKSSAPSDLKPYIAVVKVKQKGELNEPTRLGFSFDQGKSYAIQVPIVPGISEMDIADPPAHIHQGKDGELEVEILLPQKPSQIMVDPDQIVPDRDPTNNTWKGRPTFRVTPLYSFIDETTLTAPYDRWSFIAGPWAYGPSYQDPWFLRSDVIGPRLGAYKTDWFSGGVYTGYRPNFRDVAAGFDAQWNNVLPKLDIGIHGEKSLFPVGGGGDQLDRTVLYSRYVFTESSSLYWVPMHYAEAFTAWQHNYLPVAREVVPGAERFNNLSQVGGHYHLDFETPYWNPERGFRFDMIYAAGFPILGQPAYSQQMTSQLSWVWTPPESTGALSDTHFAFRAYGAAGLPTQGQLFTLGGNQAFRGFDLAERQGNLAWVTSVEWRVPVIKDVEWDVLDHVVGLRNMYLAPFYDAGEMFSSGKVVGGNVAHALGLGLRVDLSWFSFLERTTFRVDVAKTINAPTPTQFWFNIMNPF